MFKKNKYIYIFIYLYFSKFIKLLSFFIEGLNLVKILSQVILALCNSWSSSKFLVLDSKNKLWKLNNP